jgi:hypothetical protein
MYTGRPVATITVVEPPGRNAPLKVLDLSNFARQAGTICVNNADGDPLIFTEKEQPMSCYGYCRRSESSILSDIKRGGIPSEALVNSCCWKRICQVRGLHFNEIDDETWRDICRQRGYVFARENPRGF